MVLDHDTSKPLYKQLEEVLLNQIETGALTPGSKLPTEAELSKEYGLSRVTIRKTLDELSKKCLLERRAGKGTYIATKKLSRSISNVTCFSDMCRIQGLKPDAKTIRLDLADPEPDERQRMKLNDHDKIILLERLRFADEIPVSIEITKFSEKFFFLFKEDLNHVSLYEVLRKHGIVFTNSSKMLEIKFAGYKESRLLNLPKNHPLLFINSIVSDVNGEFINLSCQILAADKFKFFV